MSLGHNFRIDIAEQYGVDVAIFINNIAHWVRENTVTNRNIHDGRAWTYNTQKAFTQIFSYWTRDQIRTITKNCKKHGLLIEGNYNKAKYDTTIWYTLSDKMLIAFNLTKPENKTPGEISPSHVVEIPNLYQIENTDSKQTPIIPFKHGDNGEKNPLPIKTKTRKKTTSRLTKKEKEANYLLFFSVWNSVMANPATPKDLRLHHITGSLKAGQPIINWWLKMGKTEHEFRDYLNNLLEYYPTWVLGSWGEGRRNTFLTLCNQSTVEKVANGIIPSDEEKNFNKTRGTNEQTRN